MRLTPFARFFITVVILAVAGYAVYHYKGADIRKWTARKNLGGTTTTSSSDVSESSASPWFRMHGSNTIGSVLAPRLAEAFLKDKGATNVKTSQVSGQAETVQVAGTLPGESAPRVIEIQSRGSATGFQDLGAGSCDLAMSSRDIKPAEVAKLSPSLGDLSQPSSDRVVGLDGVAVIVNRDNPLQRIDLDDLARIFSGGYRDWSAVPGAGSGSIFVAARDEKSGTWETFRDRVLQPHDAELQASRRFEDSGELARTVRDTQGAIGFVGMPYARGLKTLEVGHRGMTPLQATPLTVRLETYPIRRRLHLYVPASAPPAAKDFAQFALSNKSWDIVEDAGFVSLRPDPKQATPPPQYPSIARGAEVLYNLYFQPGKSELDTVALDNLDRITELLSRPENRGAQILLFGHADNTGTRQANLQLSINRAEGVRAKLMGRGVPIAVTTGFGQEVPVEPNDTPEGREHNRRVEVWVKR